MLLQIGSLEESWVGGGYLAYYLLSLRYKVRFANPIQVRLFLDKLVRQLGPNDDHRDWRLQWSMEVQNITSIYSPKPALSTPLKIVAYSQASLRLDNKIDEGYDRLLHSFHIDRCWFRHCALRVPSNRASHTPALAVIAIDTTEQVVWYLICWWCAGHMVALVAKIFNKKWKQNWRKPVGAVCNCISISMIELNWHIEKIDNIIN